MTHVRAERPQRIDDALIIRRDDHLAHALALLRLIHHVLNERLAGLGGENFGGKRVDPKRAGMTTVAAKVDPQNVKKGQLQTAERI